MNLLSQALKLFKQTAARWDDDDCLRLGASLAFYALFSIFPLLLLLVTGFGFLLGQGGETRDEVLASLNATSSPDGMKLLNDTLVSMQEHHTARGVGALVGFFTLLVGASGVFSELDYAFNLFWRVPKREDKGFWRGLIFTLKEKAASVALVIGFGLFVLASLATSTVLGTLDRSVGVYLPWAWNLVELVFSLGFLTLTFAAMFRVLPQTHVAWKDVGWGALLTSLLFTIVKRLLSWYLSNLGSYAAYGAVGAVLGLLMWIYLSSQILYFGAIFTRVYAESFGSAWGASAARLGSRGDADRHVRDEGGEPKDRPRPHPFPKRPVRS